MIIPLPPSIYSGQTLAVSTNSGKGNHSAARARLWHANAPLDEKAINIPEKSVQLLVPKSEGNGNGAAEAALKRFFELTGGKEVTALPSGHQIKTISLLEPGLLEIYLKMTAGNGSWAVDLSAYAPNVHDECSPLKVAIVSPPNHLGWEVAINEKEKTSPQPDKELAVRQYESMCEVLQRYGVKLITVPPSPYKNEGVYTRDPVIVIGKKLFYSTMATDVRQPEVWSIFHSKGQHLSVYHPIEGGDVILGGNKKIFLGIGPRTSFESARILNAKLNYHWVIYPLELAPLVLHGDCSTNALARHVLLYPPGFKYPNQVYDFFVKMYGVEKVVILSDEEYALLGPNVFSINPDTILVGNPFTAGKLRKLGYNPIMLDFSQMLLAEGLFRCCIHPLVRES